MKRALLFVSVVLLSVACKKSPADITTIRYEFTSDVSASYQLDYATSKSDVTATILNGTMWSQNIVVSTDSLTHFLTVAKLTARPPSAWANTANSAHVNLRISVNGEEKVSKDTLMEDAASGAGISISYSF